MKLNLGSGNDYKEGYVNVDRDNRIKADVYCDLNKGLLPFETNSVSEIAANHIVEHLLVEAFIPFMNECHRVLEPGGQLLIETPSPLCEWFWQDPTHIRGYTRNTFGIYFCQKTFATYGISLWSGCEVSEMETQINAVKAIVIRARMTK